MDLSIVIVSFNVLPFLRQCLKSISYSCDDLAYEIIVIDNASSDGSSVFLKGIDIPQLTIIINESNNGYGKAMNQGMNLAKGEFILMLNPDTIITKESVDQSLDKLKRDHSCGAVGVRMVDGNGNFLKESKRGYPTLGASFFKLIGLSKIFPKSKVFAGYHLGHLEERMNHKVDVLTGAFLLSRRSLLVQLGGFDERYFMYGEDIDLSHEIAQSGHYNYYIGATDIIHFKGESTKRASIKSTYHFYNSMRLFVKKHHGTNKIYVGLLTIAIFIAGIAEWFQKNLLSKTQILARWIVYIGVFYSISRLWGAYNFGNSHYLNYTNHLLLIATYATLLLAGFYRSTSKKSVIKNLLIALAVTLMLYSLLPLVWRTSRAVILLGGISIVILEFIVAIASFKITDNQWRFWNFKKRGILVGNLDSCKSALSQLRLHNAIDYLGIIGDKITDREESLTDINHLEGYLSSHKIDVLTMHMDSMSMDHIMTIISKYGPSYQYLLYSQETNTIIDSPDSRSKGTVSLVEISWDIDKSENRMIKRGLDIGISTIFLLLSPILIWFVGEGKEWIKNIFSSLSGKISWVGYNREDKSLHALPRLKPAVISISYNFANAHSDNVAYARDYTLMSDIIAIFDRFASLGDKVELHG